MPLIVAIANKSNIHVSLAFYHNSSLSVSCLLFLYVSECLDMLAERLGNILLIVLEMRCQHIVDVAGYRHLVLADDLYQLHDAVMEVTADADLLSFACRHSRLSHKGFLIVTFHNAFLVYLKSATYRV